MKLIKEIHKEGNPTINYSEKTYNSKGEIIIEQINQIKTEYSRDENGLLLKKRIKQGSDFGQVGKIFEKEYKYYKNGYTALLIQTKEIHDVATRNTKGGFVSQEEYERISYEDVYKVVEVEEFTKSENKTVKTITNLTNNNFNKSEYHYENDKIILKHLFEKEGEKSFERKHYFKNELLLKSEHFMCDKKGNQELIGFSEYEYNEDGELVEEIEYGMFYDTIYPYHRKLISYEEDTIYEERLGYDSYDLHENLITKEVFEMGALNLENKNNLEYNSVLKIFDKGNLIEERVLEKGYNFRHLYIYDFNREDYLIKKYCLKVREEDFSISFTEQYIYEN